MTNIESYSTSNSIGVTSKQFLWPGWSQLLLYVLVSFLLLLVFNVKNAWSYLNNNIIAPQGGLGAILSSNNRLLKHIFNSFSHSIVLQVLFWVAIGCFVYVIIWFIRNIAINIMNDIAADNYVHPATYKRLRFWESILVRKVFSGISIFTLIIYIGASTKMVMYLSGLCFRLVQNFQPIRSLLEIAACVLVTTVLVYILILLTHVAVMSWRLIYRDL